MKKERAGRRQNGIEEGDDEIWDLKYKNSEDLETKLKKCTNNHHILNQQARIDIGVERVRVF